jgi:uncharacterized protein (DUF58 family)
MEITRQSPAGAISRTPRRRGFAAWLHRTYFRTTGAHFFFSRRFRPAGVALGLVFVLATCLGIGHERGSIYQLFSLTFAMLALGLPLALLRRAKLQATREVPRYATAGEPLRYPVRVRNHGRRSISRAWLGESPPDPRPDVTDFTNLREPGEEERNGFDRTFAYFRWQWLMLRNRLFTEGVSADEIRLKPDESSRVFIELTPLRRGVIRLHDLRVFLPDPMGLFQRCRKVRAEPSTITVLPRRHPLPLIEMPGGAAFQITGESNTNSIGNSGEFTGLRDYRAGDPLRQIHWKSWARTGRPIVKELENTHYPRYGLVLDTLSTDRADVVFEETVTVAASFAAAIDTSESLLDLMFVKNEAHLVTAGRGVERAEKLLEVLAAVTPEREGDFKALARLVLRHAEDLTSCLIVLNGWDALRSQFVATLRQGGILCAPIVIGHGPRPPGVPGYWIESGQVARDLKRMPRQLATLD